MKRSFSSFMLLFLAVSFATQSVAGKSSSDGPSSVVRLKLSDLRSAYLLRAGVVHYDTTQNTPDGIRAASTSLRYGNRAATHFDA